MNLCVDCKFYQAGCDVENDICLHDKAVRNNNIYHGIRQLYDPERYACGPMRAGICRDGLLFEPKAPKEEA